MESTAMKTLALRHAIEHFIDEDSVGEVHGSGMFVDGSSADISATIEGVKYKITIEPKNVRNQNKTQ